MTKEIKYIYNKPVLSLYACNEKEVFELQNLYKLLNKNSMVVGENKGNFHYGINIDLVKDE